MQWNVAGQFILNRERCGEHLQESVLWENRGNIVQDWGFGVFHAFYFLQKNPLKHFWKVRIRYAMILVGKSRHLEGKMIDSCAGCPWWLWTLFQGKWTVIALLGSFQNALEALPSNKINIGMMDIPLFCRSFSLEILFLGVSHGFSICQFAEA